MLGFIGSFILAGTAAVLLVAASSSPPLTQTRRFALAGFAGGWIGVVVAATAAGVFTKAAAFPLFFAIPLVAVIVLALTSASIRNALLAVPVPLLIALNVMRVAGVLFLLLAATGQLSGPFPYFAGIGDIITGLFALPVARIAATTSIHNARVIAWNIFGMLDLILAVGLGVTSNNGSPLQLIHAGAGSSAIVTLPWSLVPLVIVPTYLVIHGVIFYQLRADVPQRAARTIVRTASV